MRLADTGDLVDPAPLGQVNDFDGMVFQGGDEQALRSGVKGQMVEATFDTFERNGADWDERFTGSGELRREGEASQCQERGPCGQEGGCGLVG